MDHQKAHKIPEDKLRLIFSKKVLLLGLITGFLGTGCAGTPDLNPVQEARQSYQKIEDDTLIVKNAPVELKKAGEAVEDLKKSMDSGGSQASVEQQAQLAKQRVEIAKKAAELRAAQDQVQRTSNELKLLLDRLRQIERGQTGSAPPEVEAVKRARDLINFDAQRTNRGLILRFKRITFDQEEATLNSRAEPPVNELADFLDAYPERKVIIEGHTDNTGSQSFNQKLSQQRADAVRNALISRGILATRIKAVGLGEQYPRTSNDTEAGRQYNRRVDIIISDKSGKIPDRQ